MPDFLAQGSQRAFPENAHPQDECHDKQFQDKCIIQCDTGYTQSTPKITLPKNQAEFTCAAGPDTDSTSTRSPRSDWHGDLACQSALSLALFSSSR